MSVEKSVEHNTLVQDNKTVEDEINMYVTKRNGNIEKISYDKIITRLKQ